MQSLSFLNCNQVKCQSDIPDLSAFHVTELFLLKLFDLNPLLLEIQFSIVALSQLLLRHREQT